MVKKLGRKELQQMVEIVKEELLCEHYTLDDYIEMAEEDSYYKREMEEELDRMQEKFRKEEKKRESGFKKHIEAAHFWCRQKKGFQLRIEKLKRKLKNNNKTK